MGKTESEKNKGKILKLIENVDNNPKYEINLAFLETIKKYYDNPSNQVKANYNLINDYISKTKQEIIAKYNDPKDPKQEIASNDVNKIILLIKFGKLDKDAKTKLNYCINKTAKEIIAKYNNPNKTLDPNDVNKIILVINWAKDEDTKKILQTKLDESEDEVRLQQLVDAAAKSASSQKEETTSPSAISQKDPLVTSPDISYFQNVFAGMLSKLPEYKQGAGNEYYISEYNKQNVGQIEAVGGSIGVKTQKKKKNKKKLRQRTIKNKV